MPLLVAILLGLSAVLIVIFPLLGFEHLAEARHADDLAQQAADVEHAARLSLRDVEFDYRLGNLEEQDYGALRAQYEDRALQALKERYDQEQELDARIDAELQALKTAPANEEHVMRAGSSSRHVSARARRRKGGTR